MSDRAQPQGHPASQPRQSPGYRIMLIEDNADHQLLERKALEGLAGGTEVVAVATALEGLAALGQQLFDLVVADYQMPGMDGLAFLRALNQRHLTVPVIIVTGLGNERVAVDALKQGAHDYVIKDASYLHLLPSIAERAIAAFRTQRQLEEARCRLAESEERYRQLVHGLDAIVWEADPTTWQFTFVSQRAEAILGYRVEQWLTEADFWMKIIHPQDRQQVMDACQCRASRRRIHQFEVRARAADGRTVWLRNTVRAVCEQGEVTSLRGLMVDMTEYKRTEAERQVIFEIIQGVMLTANLDELLRRIHQSLKKVLYAENCFVALYDRNTGMFEFPFFVDQYDCVPPPQKLAKSGTAYVFRTGQPLLITEALFGHLVEQGEIELVGTPSPSWLGVPLKTPAETIGVLVVQHYGDEQAYSQRDLKFLASVGGQIALAIERKRAEVALAAEKERLAVTLRSIGDGVITTDTHGHVVLLNKVAETLTGWTQEEAAGKPLTEVFHIINEKTREGCDNPVEKVLKTGGLVGLANHTALIARDGTERLIADSGAPIRDRDGHIIGAVLVFRDTTEEQKMEQELLKAQKLESLGLLAGGIAHDFNNILMGITGNISLAKLFATPGDKIFHQLAAAEKASLRARELTQQLLTFSKGGAPIKKTASLVDLIKDSAEFALRGSNVQCRLALEDTLWPVEVDEGQISQVINNLMINADQAMPDGGIIQVRAENVSLDADQGVPLDPGNYVKLTIADQGVGIPAEHLHKIFDPYFTTKQKGSGLGLTTAYSIIKRHDGTITVESTPGVGTTFSLYLPASEKEAEQKPQAGADSLVGQGKILVMDDEALIREVAGQMLTRFGYEVDVARDGAEAIELYARAQQSGFPYDAVIMDLTVPGGMGGREAIQKLLEIDPQVKAIVSSGYSNDPVMAQFRHYGFRGVVAKPYKIEELGQTLKRVLNGNLE